MQSGLEGPGSHTLIPDPKKYVAHKEVKEMTMKTIKLTLANVQLLQASLSSTHRVRFNLPPLKQALGVLESLK